MKYYVSFKNERTEVEHDVKYLNSGDVYWLDEIPMNVKFKELNSFEMIVYLGNDETEDEDDI